MDAGDFTGETTVPGRMLTDALIEGMNVLGYQVSNLGQRELQDGYDLFLERKGKARFEFVSANVVWQDTGEPIVAPTVVRKVALRPGARARDIRLGFIGLTQNNPAFLVPGPGGRRIVTIDPAAAAARWLPELRRKADVIVALVGMELQAGRALTKKSKEIDLILGGGGAAQTRSDDFPEDTLFGRTRLLYIGDQGKNLGEVRLVLAADRSIASQTRNVVGLSREWPEAPDLARVMEATKVAINDYNRAQTEAASPFAPAAAPAAAAPEAAAPAAAVFSGSGRCAACHDREHEIWQRSAHAHAFETLVKASQDFNPRCVGCHTIGFGAPNGFVDARSTPGLVNVGCESCHGPSGRHPEGGAPYGKTDVSACAVCHTSENSPDFVPAEYVPKIRHWTDTQAAH